MPELLLVRHARAGARGSGPADLDRPLDERGRAQAAALPALLRPELLRPELLRPELQAGMPAGAGGAGGVEVRSSPARRCRETIQPLALALDVEVIVDDALVEGCDVRVLHDRIAAIDRPTVWCSHGDVIPELLTMLARSGVDLGPDPRCRKGSTWIISIEAGEAVAARSLAPPG